MEKVQTKLYTKQEIESALTVAFYTMKGAMIAAEGTLPDPIVAQELTKHSSRMIEEYNGMIRNILGLDKVK